MNISEANSRPDGTALQLVTRHYYERERSVCADPSMEGTVNISISLVDTQGTSEYLSLLNALTPALTDTEMAKKLKAVKMFVKAFDRARTGSDEAPKWFSFTLNKFGNPAVFRDENTGESEP